MKLTIKVNWKILTSEKPVLSFIQNTSVGGAVLFAKLRNEITSIVYMNKELEACVQITSLKKKFLPGISLYINIQI